MKKSCWFLPYALAFGVLFGACRPTPRFQRLSPDDTGIAFSNALTIRDSLNILDNEFIYNGGGVAVGDYNGDGRPDLFFTANMVDNALYLNRGDWKFEDVTRRAGVGKPNACWSAGATVVDINADGKLDLYVSNMMHGQPDLRRNLLYVNQGNDAQGVPRFREMAGAYHLQSEGFSAQTVFFDYDNDGDPDAYVMVNKQDMQFANQYLSVPMRAGSPTADRLLRNDFDARLGHAVFTDVSRQAGIQAQGYGHGVSVMDINKDGWLDIYVSNDYLSNDHLFINNRNGGFTDRVHECFKHLSWSAMGNDVADINNDAALDILTTDMLPDYNARKKALLRANNYTHYLFTRQYGYEYQHIRNTLQLNQGLDPRTGLPRFSEISLLAGVSETDWSWCPLWLDLDNDGYRDLLVTNGFPKDISDQDFLAYRNDIQAVVATKAELHRQIPEVKIPNYVFRNKGDLTFEDKSADWGFGTPSFSNGAAYADLDGDGDLDLVVNNINDYAHVYRNTLDEQTEKPHFLRINLIGTRLNPMGIGAKIQVFLGKTRLYAEQSVVRGYLSTSEATVHFGLGKTSRADSVRVVWPDGQEQTLRRVAADQTLTVRYATNLPQARPEPTPVALFEEIFPASLGISYQHPETDFVDFNVQKTLPHKFSNRGPGVAVGDVNGDGLDDFFLAGPSREEGVFFFQQKSGGSGQPAFRASRQDLKTSPGQREEDSGVLFFDADGDGDSDLYCARGGYRHGPGAPVYQDALFVNDGRGNFRRDSLALPPETANNLTVRATDFDRDGDLDLFVGGNVLPGAYPKPDRSFLLRNDCERAGSEGRKVKFTDVTRQVAPGLDSVGIVTDALWTDANNDNWPDLLLVGEWMAPTFFLNRNGNFNHSITQSLNSLPGWWTSLSAGDFDNDGDVDYVAGNYGLNITFHAAQTEPLWVYANDFDANGSYDALVAHYDNDALGERHLYPYHTRDDLIKQSILFRQRFQKYADLGRADWKKVLTEAESRAALVKKATWLKSNYFENRGNGPDGTPKFVVRALPVQAQLAPVFGTMPCDVNADGLLDLLLVGNDYGMELHQGRADAFCGLVLLNRGKGPFHPLSLAESGFVVPGEARALTRLTLASGEEWLMATQNQDSLRGYRLRRSVPGPVVRLRPTETHGLLRLANGQTRRVEFYNGSSFQSQESRSGRWPGATALELYNSKGISRIVALR